MPGTRAAGSSCASWLSVVIPDASSLTIWSALMPATNTGMSAARHSLSQRGLKGHWAQAAHRTDLVSRTGRSAKASNLRTSALWQANTFRQDAVSMFGQC